MTDDEIVARINTQLYVAIVLQMMSSCAERLDPWDVSRSVRLHKTAGLFMSHALELLVTHRLAAARWLDARLPEPQWVARLQ